MKLKCPSCAEELLASVRNGIEIDCCPRCGGMWLDHGEFFELLVALGDTPGKRAKNILKIIQDSREFVR